MDWKYWVLFVPFAMVGGAIGSIMRKVNHGEVPKFWMVMLEAAASGFAGVLVMLLCQAMDLSMQWTGVIVGVCGWLGGGATMQMLEKIVYKKTGIDNEPR